MNKTKAYYIENYASIKDWTVVFNLMTDLHHEVYYIKEISLSVRELVKLFGDNEIQRYDDFFYSIIRGQVLETGDISFVQLLCVKFNIDLVHSELYHKIKDFVINYVVVN